jgi:hypothetical protein
MTGDLQRDRVAGQNAIHGIMAEWPEETKL